MFPRKWFSWSIPSPPLIFHAPGNRSETGNWRKLAETGGNWQKLAETGRNWQETGKETGKLARKLAGKLGKLEGKLGKLGNWRPLLFEKLAGKLAVAYPLFG